MRLVMLSGWAGSGNDSCADYLVEKHGFSKLSFAKILKDQTAKQYKIPRFYFDDRDWKDKPLPAFPVAATDGFAEHIHKFMAGEYKEIEEGSGRFYHTPRSLLILEGSMKRAVDPNYWVKRLVKQLKPNQSYVIPDWRYQSELQAICDQGIAPTTVRIERFAETASLSPSERDLDNINFDHTIYNLSNLEELFLKAKLILQLQ
jgi:hypothetical protein